MKKGLMTRTPSGRLREPNLNLELPLGGKKMRKLGCKALTQSSSSYDQLQSPGVNVASGWQDPPSPHNPHPHPGAEKVKTSPVSWFGDFCSLPGAYEATERNDARILEEEKKKSTGSWFSYRMRVDRDLFTHRVAFALEEMPHRTHSRSIGDSGRHMRLGVTGKFLVSAGCQLAVWPWTDAIFSVLLPCSEK